MKLPFLVSMASYFRRNPPKPMTVSQEGIQARAIRHLIATGYIDARTVLHMGTTDAHKMFTRMRRIGVLYPADDANGHILMPNSAGQGCFRRHKWTGMLPASWSAPATERRAKVRGGKPDRNDK